MASEQLMKLASIATLFVAEALVIYAELIAAKSFSATNNFALSIIKVAGIAVVGTSFLIIGYMLGFRHFQNIWIVTAVSISAIVISEPVLNILIFGQYPTTGALVGLLLGFAGLVSATIF